MYVNATQPMECLGNPEDPELTEASPSGESINVECPPLAELNEALNPIVVNVSLSVVEPSSLAKLPYHSKKRKDKSKVKINKLRKASHQKTCSPYCPASTTIELTLNIELNHDSSLGSEEEDKDPL
ncbi:hypothetical protein ACFE04_029516 [Oxalis oulophora]